VEARIRAGVLEPGTVELLKRAQVSAHMERDGLAHDGFRIASGYLSTRIDLKRLAGAPVTVYGQTEITQDLIAARLALNGAIVFEAEDVIPLDFAGRNPRVTYTKDGRSHEITCDFIAGCDGSHGISRASVPPDAITLYESSLPFGWLGVLSDTPPVDHELIYSRGEGGFALCSMRSPARSRYYVQVPLADTIEQWPDQRFWDELRRRIPEEAAASLIIGPSLEKSIAPLRSFVAEPMQFGRLFLAGDAAHIVPPTGAKGLNLAVSDVAHLADALIAYHVQGDGAFLDFYSEACLARVWRAVRFSWWFTGLTHRFDDAFGAKLQLAEWEYIYGSEAAQTVIAENYIGRTAK
jgi:p-hydroxybenzoate 3-monooxygenase